jgi:hypothetical protein
MGNNLIIVNTCMNNKLVMAKYLKDKFDINSSDIRSRTSKALKQSCLKGNSEMTKWLVEEFDFKKEDLYLFDDESKYDILKQLLKVNKELFDWLDVKFNIKDVFNSHVSYFDMETHKSYISLKKYSYK